MLFDDFDMCQVKRYLGIGYSFDDAVRYVQDDIARFAVVDTLEDVVNEQNFYHLNKPMNVEDFDSMSDNSGFTFVINGTKWQVKMEKVEDTQEPETRHTKRID